MSARVRRHIDVLKVLLKAKVPLRKAILTNSDQQLILALCEIVKNVLLGNVKLPPKQKKALTRHSALLRKLSDKRIDVKTKKKLFIQRGGFLPAILGPALGLLASVIGNVI